MDFDTNTMNVVLKAGASFQVQKSRTIMMIKEMMGMSPLFAQFLAEKGLNFVLDNMEGKGIEELKKLTQEWSDEYQKEKQQAMQAQQAQAQQNPAAMKAQVDMAKLKQQAETDKMKYHMEMMKIQADLKIEEEKASVGLVKAQTERFAKTVDLEIKRHDNRHRHLKEAIETHHKGLETHHKITQPRKAANA